MASENVELVRAILAEVPTDQAAQLEDEEGIRAVLAAVDPLLHPDFTFEPASGQVATGLKDTYHGSSGFLDFMREWTSAFETWRYEAEEIIDVGNDRVLVLNRLSGRTRSGGIEIEAQAGEVWTINDGKGFRLQSFFDRDEAREAAGLPPDRVTDESHADERS